MRAPSDCAGARIRFARFFSRRVLPPLVVGGEGACGAWRRDSGANLLLSCSPAFRSFSTYLPSLYHVIPAFELTYLPTPYPGARLTNGSYLPTPCACLM